MNDSEGRIHKGGVYGVSKIYCAFIYILQYECRGMLLKISLISVGWNLLDIILQVWFAFEIIEGKRNV